MQPGTIWQQPPAPACPIPSTGDQPLSCLRLASGSETGACGSGILTGVPLLPGAVCAGQAAPAPPGAALPATAGHWDMETQPSVTLPAFLGTRVRAKEPVPTRSTPSHGTLWQPGPGSPAQRCARHVPSTPGSKQSHGTARVTSQHSHPSQRHHVGEIPCTTCD